MPSFGRPFKHSNRSQQALAEPLAGAPSVVAATAAVAGAATTPSTGSHQPDSSPANSATAPRSALSSSAYGTSASNNHPYDPRFQQQHQHQQQQLAEPQPQELLQHQHHHHNLRQLAQQQQQQQQQQLQLQQHPEADQEDEEAVAQAEDAREPQHQQQSAPAPAPPQHLFNPNSWPLPQTPDTATASPSSPAVEDHQLPTDNSADPSTAQARARAHILTGRKHPHRLSAALLQQSPPFPEQQQQAHPQHQAQLNHGIGIASTSYDDLPNPAAYYQQPIPITAPTAAGPPTSTSASTTALATAPAPEKRSARKLIKGIFSGSSRSAHDGPQYHQHHHHQHHLSHPHQHPQHNLQGRSTPTSANHNHQYSESNSAGVIRRHSKRISTPPNLKTGFSHQPKLTPRREWPGTQSQTNSPLVGAGEFDEYHEYRFPVHKDIPPQASRPLFESSSKANLASHSSSHTSTTPAVAVAAAAAAATATGTTIRQVPDDPDNLPYDDEQDYEPPQQHPHPHPQQTHHIQQPPLLQQHQRPSSPYRSHLRQDQDHRYHETDYDHQLLTAGSEQQHETQRSQFDNLQQQGLYQQARDQRGLSNQLGPDPRLQGADTSSQKSYESPITDSDQRSTNQQSTQTSSPTNYAAGQAHDLALNANQPPGQLVTPPQPQQSGMASGPSLPQHNRRVQSSQIQSQAQSQAQAQALAQSHEAEKVLQGQIEPPPGPTLGYRHSASSINHTMSPLPPPSQQQGAAGVPQAYRGERPPPQFETQASDQGRDSPSLLNPDQGAADAEKAFKDLLTKYKNVKRLYFDGKSQIEQLSGQVEQLQNAVANQRMSQSRTALDDNEYTTRFSRLNGAINNLSFNIRKDWRTVPQWLEKFVSPDALKTGKQEMTAVGRAIISRWLVEEVFNKCFHPGLDQSLSAQLKEIELSIRGNAYNMQSQEEYDALTTRIVNWRMATLDGLQRRLNSPATTEHRTMLISKATSQLTQCLYQYLASPPPPGVEGSTSMIVELAVGIAANLPLESRDVAITYPLPGDLVQPHLMEVEKTGLPVLEVQKPEADAEVDDEVEKEKTGKLQKAKPAGLSAMMAGNAQPRKGSNASNLGGDDAVPSSGLPKDVGIVRFAGFVALEVRGRQVLMKAPVWTL